MLRQLLQVHPEDLEILENLAAMLGHVGQGEFAANRKGQALWLAGWLHRYLCLQVEGEGRRPSTAQVQPRWRLRC